MDENVQAPLNLQQPSFHPERTGEAMDENQLQDSIPVKPDKKNQYKKVLLYVVTPIILLALMISIYFFYRTRLQGGSKDIDQTTTQASKDSQGTTGNVPPIPGANILLVVKDVNDALISTPRVKVEVFFDNSYYNYDYEIGLNDNPFLIGMPLTSDQGSSVRISAIKYRYSWSDPVQINIDEFWDKHQRVMEKGIIDEITSNTEIPEVALSRSKELAKDATMYKVIMLSLTSQDLESFEQLRHSDETLLLVYYSESDDETDLLKQKWQYLTSKYSDIKKFELSKVEVDEILGNERLIKANESVIIIYSNKLSDTNSLLYFGNESSIEAMLGYTVFIGENWFESFENRLQFFSSKP